jgi:hypothetical protein
MSLTVDEFRRELGPLTHTANLMLAEKNFLEKPVGTDAPDAGHTG